MPHPRLARLLYWRAVRSKAQNPGRWCVAGAALVLGLLHAEAALACAACACGDPTLTVAGTEKPFAGRLRLALELQHRTDAVGRERVNRIELSEQRLELGVAWAPVEWLALSARLPVIRREVSFVNLERDLRTRPGDLEVRAQLFALRREGLSQRHVLAAHFGLGLPLAPAERDERGALLATELQPGTGSIDPLVGLSWSFFARPYSVYASTTLYVPTADLRAEEGEAGALPRRGLSLRSSLAGQWDLAASFGVRLSLDTRLEQAAQLGGEAEPDSGGFITFASPELVISPVTDLVLRLAIRLPVLDGLVGDHDEGPMLFAGAAYDL